MTVLRWITVVVQDIVDTIRDITITQWIIVAFISVSALNFFPDWFSLRPSISLRPSAPSPSISLSPIAPSQSNDGGGGGGGGGGGAISLPPYAPYDGGGRSGGGDDPEVSRGYATAAERVTFGAVMDKFLSAMQKANIAFNAPSPMHIDDTRRVVLKLDLNKTGKQLASEISEEGKKETATIDVSETMTAHLKGDDFTVTPLGAETQSLSAAQTTTWAWEVTPKTWGTLGLTVTLDAEFASKDETRHRHIREFKKDIEVNVWPPTVKDVQKFAASNWQWLLGALPLGAAFAWWKRKRSDDVPV